MLKCRAWLGARFSNIGRLDGRVDVEMETDPEFRLHQHERKTASECIAEHIILIPRPAAGHEFGYQSTALFEIVQNYLKIIFSSRPWGCLTFLLVSDEQQC
jgi:hypothetical protein